MSGVHGCCYRCLKYLVLIFNLIFSLLGFAVLVVACWLYIDTSTYIQLSAKSDDFNKGLFVFIAIGVLMLFVGVLGCCGALMESQCMLCSFFVFLVMIFVAEVTVTVLAIQNKENLTKIFKESITSLVQYEYSGQIDEPRTAVMDEIQRQLKCCGGQGYQDWRESKYNGNEGRVNLGPLSGVETLVKAYRVPSSCCKAEISSENCREATTIDPGTSFVDSIAGNLLPRSIYTDGCTDKLLHLFELHREYFIAIGLFVAVVEVLGMIVSMVLCCAIRRLDDMKV